MEFTTSDPLNDPDLLDFQQTWKASDPGMQAIEDLFEPVDISDRVGYVNPIDLVCEYVPQPILDVLARVARATAVVCYAMWPRKDIR